MKYARRFLAVLLCLLMVAAMLPTQVLAATDERYEGGDPSGTTPVQPCNHLESRSTTTGTCTQPGRQVGFCVLCGQTLWVEYFEPMGHFAGPYVLIEAPTCTVPGTEEQYCLRCNALLDTRSIPALGHEFGEWIRIQEPTDTENGIDERYCVRQDVKERRTFKIGSNNVVFVTIPLSSVYPNNPKVDLGTPTEPSVPEEVGEPEDGAQTASGVLVKYITSTPLNGYAFVPGEVLHYAFELINTGEVMFQSAAIHDPLVGICGSGTDIYPGGRVYGSMDYTVTEADAACGSLSNQAYAPCVTEDGEVLTIYSNTVVVPTTEAPFGVISGLSLSKSATSTPANGSYYTAGETITYTITASNIGEIDLGETVVYDALGNVELGSAEMLHSGESRSFYFSYTVTEADVKNGSVTNVASAIYDDNGITRSAMSNYVVSDTDGKPDDGAPGKITLPLVLSGEGEGYTPCTLEIQTLGETGAEFEERFCSIHGETQQTIDAMLAGSSNEAARTKAWKFARGMWEVEINTMYDSLLELCDPIASMVVTHERTQFFAMLNRYEQTLHLLEVSDANIALAMAEMTRNKAVEMCYELHTAPEARLDSVHHAAGSYAGAECEDCTRLTEQKDDGSIGLALQLCPEHSFTAQMGNALLESGQDTAWENVLWLWQMDLQSSYAILRTGFDAEGKHIADADFAAFSQWVEARQMLLSLLYPNDTDTQREVLAYAAENRTMDLCGLMKG